jgi:hypothetical protein
MVVGSAERYLSWDESRGNLELKGEITNLSSPFLDGREGSGFFAVQPGFHGNYISNYFDGPGAYVIIMTGGGGGGQGVLRANQSGFGGAGGGACIFTLEWDGSTSIIWSSGAAGTAGAVTNNSPNSTNAGSASNLSWGNTVFATANGGEGGFIADSTNNPTRPAGGNGVLSNNFGNNFGPGFIFSATRSGGVSGSNSFNNAGAGLACGGGGVDMLGNANFNLDGGNSFGGYAGGGGHMFASGEMSIHNADYADQDLRFPDTVKGMMGLDPGHMFPQYSTGFVGGMGIFTNSNDENIHGGDAGYFAGGGGLIHNSNNLANNQTNQRHLHECFHHYC